MEKTFEEYFNDVWCDIPEYVVSDEYMAKNNELITQITFELFDMHDKWNNMPPLAAKKVLAGLFVNISKYGIR